MSQSVIITLRLNNIQEVKISINGAILHLNSGQMRDTLFSQLLILEKISIQLQVWGPIGSSLEIQVLETTLNRVFSSRIGILKESIVEKTFNLQISDFNTRSQPEGKRIRETISFGKDNRGIVRTEESTNHTVKVFFATDRALVESESRLIYTDDRSYLKYGMADVNIPKKKKQGELPRPHWWKLQFSENKDKHVLILQINALDKNNFFKLMNSHLNSSIDNDSFIFIHGFNTSFEDSILKTAQLAYDLGFCGVPITYTWPSSGAVLKYLRDEESVAFAVNHFVTFLKEVKELSSTKKIHFIAHSMGNRLLTRALAELRKNVFFKQFTFGQVILAAPDIDAELFINDLAPSITGVSERTTLYASSEDKALRFSRTIHSSIIRLGESGKFITCYEGIDTVDASSSDPDFLGHGYFAEAAQLIGDIFQLFRKNAPPVDRNLVLMNSKENDIYWSFR